MEIEKKNEKELQRGRLQRVAVATKQVTEKVYAEEHILYTGIIF